MNQWAFNGTLFMHIKFTENLKKNGKPCKENKGSLKIYKDIVCFRNKQQLYGIYLFLWIITKCFIKKKVRLTGIKLSFKKE